ncbi:hypothetical protein P691DRAFT_791989 [Macrolepiota fuliginosa MF-IS2]|uniref:Uncharacterized protein n=1 Tax=Macrolepiota fuliginosa MF-IS2 TaxID=1400762 RepID=A0A9P5XFG4_9AGAR|nr:hypothetical protein P691DRAFT_791989 [Macrolepiota fuliginosa MF-IS2]
MTGKLHSSLTGIAKCPLFSSRNRRMDPFRNIEYCSSFQFCWIKLAYLLCSGLSVIDSWAPQRMDINVSNRFHEGAEYLQASTIVCSRPERGRRQQYEQLRSKATVQPAINVLFPQPLYIVHLIAGPWQVRRGCNTRFAVHLKSSTLPHHMAPKEPTLLRQAFQRYTVVHHLTPSLHTYTGKSSPRSRPPRHITPLLVRDSTDTHTVPKFQNRNRMIEPMFYCAVKTTVDFTAKMLSDVMGAALSSSSGLKGKDRPVGDPVAWIEQGIFIGKLIEGEKQKAE